MTIELDQDAKRPYQLPDSLCDSILSKLIDLSQAQKIELSGSA